MRPPEFTAESSLRERKERYALASCRPAQIGRVTAQLALVLITEGYSLIYPDFPENSYYIVVSTQI